MQPCLSIRTIHQFTIVHIARTETLEPGLFCEKYVHKMYYFDQVTNMLESLDEFLKRTEPEIESITGEERNTASFMKMMRLFNEVHVNFSQK